MRYDLNLQEILEILTSSVDQKPFWLKSNNVKEVGPLIDKYLNDVSQNLPDCLGMFLSMGSILVELTESDLPNKYRISVETVLTTINIHKMIGLALFPCLVGKYDVMGTVFPLKYMYEFTNAEREELFPWVEIRGTTKIGKTKSCIISYDKESRIVDLRRDPRPNLAGVDVRQEN